MNIRVVVFTDALAHYRLPILSEIASKISLTVFAPRDVRVEGSLHIADALKQWPFEVVPNTVIYLRRYRIWMSGLIESVLSKRYDAVFVWGEVTNMSCWLALLGSRISGKPVYIWTHGMYGREKSLKRLLRAYMCRLAKGVLLYGERAKELIAESGIDSRKLFVIYNSLDYQKQKEIRQRLALADQNILRKELLGSELSAADGSAKILLFVGRLIPARELEVVIAAISALNKDVGEIMFLVIVGDGPDSLRLKKLAHDLGVSPYVKFLPATYDEDELGRIFWASDLAVFPGSVGLFAVHAHAYGLPVCTHDVLDWQKPEAEIIREGETGFFFKRGDAGDLARKIQQWFRTNSNPNDREIKNKCIARVEEHYTPSAQTMVFMQALEYGLRPG